MASFKDLLDHFIETVGAAGENADAVADAVAKGVAGYAAEVKVRQAVERFAALRAGLIREIKERQDALDKMGASK